MEDKSRVTIKNREFVYCSYYERLVANDGKLPEVACPKCKGTTFQLKYGNYEILAHCKCGHTMTVYDG